jgi:hypothetical protein
MAKLILSTYNAQRSNGFLQVALSIGSDGPLPSKTVEIKRTIDAAAELETYKQEAAALGIPLVVSLRIARGDRSPNGFDAFNAAGFHPVNV